MPATQSDNVIPSIEVPIEMQTRPQARHVSWSPTPGMPEAPDSDSPTPQLEPSTRSSADIEPRSSTAPTASATKNYAKRASKKQKRVVLTTADHLVLMRLCGEHRPDYRQGNITNFWDLIEALFEEDTGIKTLCMLLLVNY